MQEKGKVIAGTYRLDALIARGGMGEVYKGTHLRLGKQLAVKLMLPQYMQFGDQIKRFLNEALGVANLQHRHIVGMIDVGVTEDKVPFFVMEYLRGENLRDRLRRRPKLRPGEAARIMIQALSGVSALHQRKIVHRDMKPSNIFLAREADGSEIVKILDFGVSKFHLLEGDEIQELTTTGTIMGTPSYMSPEQAGGKKKDIDQSSDIYSCGVILYRCLAGINPFKGDNYNETIANILNAPVPRPSFFEPSLPAGIDEVILKAIERNKAARFQGCREFMDALEPFSDKNLEAADDIPEQEEIPVSLGAAGEQSGDGLTPSVSVLDMAPGAPGSAALQRPDEDLHAGESLPAATRHGPRRTLWIILAVVALVAAAAAFTGYRYLGSAMEPQNREASQQLDRPAAESPAKECRLELAGAPEAAVTYIDGVVHPERPIVLEKKQGPRRVRIEAEGFQPWEEAVAVQGDTTLKVSLDPLPASVPAETDPPAEEEKTKSKVKPSSKKKTGEGDDGKSKRKILMVYPGKTE